MNGSSFGLSVEAARTNLALRSTELATAPWSFGAGAGAPGVTVSADTTDLFDPTGATNTADKIVYDGASGTAGNFRFYQLMGASGNGTKYATSMWLRHLTGSGTYRLTSNLDGTFVANAIGATWERVVHTDTGDGATTLQVAIYSDFSSNSAFSLYGYGGQSEVGQYPSSLIVTAGASGTRNADVISIPDPTIVAPHGFFDLRLTIAPNYSQAEQAADHNLFYLGADDRVYLKASDHKVYLRIGGADVASSALTWSREQALTIRAAHRASGRSLTVSGATTGNGTATAAAAGALALPATGYILGSNTGAEECADLRGVAFSA